MKAYIDSYLLERNCISFGLDTSEAIEIGNKLGKPICEKGDTVYELCKCDDGVYRIFPMVVKSVNEYGSVRFNKHSESYEVWNIYAEGDSTCMYKSFYDLGKTLFYKEEAAKEALTEIEGEYER